MGRGASGTTTSPWAKLGVVVALAAALLALLIGPSQPGAAAPAERVQDDGAATDGDGEVDEEEAALLARGAGVFSRACTGCHQVGGVGLPGQFPPLKGNPNVTDAAYVEDVIRNGRQGPLVVAGVEYDATMPAVGASLSDEDIAAVTAYVVADLTLPEGVSAVAPPLPESPGPPTASLLLIAVGFGLAAVAAGFVLGPLVIARNDQLELSWVDAGLKAAVVVVYFVVVGLVVPGRVMELDVVTELDKNLQYVLGAAVWTGGMGLGLVALWWAGRRGHL